MAGAILGVLAAAGGSTSAVTLTNQAVSDLQFAEPAEASYSLANTGIVRIGTSSSNTDVAFWVVPQSGFASYDVQATQTASAGTGTLTGATGAWLNLATTRTWTLAQTASSGNASRTLQIDIRPAGGGATLATANINLTASSNA
jgi:hypothetical protein